MATTGNLFSGLTPTSTGNFNANNHLSSSSFAYHSAGNMTLLGTIGITYDANNRQLSTSDSSLHTQFNYSYAGLGNRVTTSVPGGAERIYVYDALGQLAAEYANAPSSPPCVTCYLR